MRCPLGSSFTLQQESQCQVWFHPFLLARSTLNIFHCLLLAIPALNLVFQIICSFITINIELTLVIPRRVQVAGEDHQQDEGAKAAAARGTHWVSQDGRLWKVNGSARDYWQEIFGKFSN